VLIGFHLNVDAQSCSANLVANWNMESTLPTAIGPFAPCATNIASWVPFKANNVTNAFYACRRNAPINDGFSSFPWNNGVGTNFNPESWDALATNTRYLSTAYRSGGGTIVNSITGFTQVLSAPLQTGRTYIARVRYAAWRMTSTAATVTVRMQFSGQTACTPNLSGAQAPLVSTYPVTAGNVTNLVWQTAQVVFTASSNWSRLHVTTNYTPLPANAGVMFYVDNVELVRKNCPYDLNGDGLVGVSDITVLNGYMGMNTSAIANICHLGADANGDGVVSSADMDLFVAQFGTICPNNMATDPNGPGDAEVVTRSILDAGQGMTLTAYPNPTRDVVRLMYAPLRHPGALLELLGPTGARLRELRPEADGAMDMDMAGLPPGLYMVRLSDGDRQELLRVVKE
jgi:hypothetical protein